MWRAVRASRYAPLTMADVESTRAAAQLRKLAATEGAIRCGVCAEQVSGHASVCSLCDAPYHTDCWKYNGGCAVFGCRAAPEPPQPIAVDVHVRIADRPPPGRAIALAIVITAFAIGPGGAWWATHRPVADAPAPAAATAAPPVTPRSAEPPVRPADVVPAPGLAGRWRWSASRGRWMGEIVISEHRTDGGFTGLLQRSDRVDDSTLEGRAEGARISFKRKFVLDGKPQEQTWYGTVTLGADGVPRMSGHWMGHKTHDYPSTDFESSKLPF